MVSCLQEALVVDVGGGSTEFIIGAQFTPRKLESPYMGCVSYSLRYFPEGRITKIISRRPSSRPAASSRP